MHVTRCARPRLPPSRLHEPAALAAPGAIDPEAVLALLRQGHAPTLDNVYAMMRRREREAANQDPDPGLSVNTPAMGSAAKPAPNGGAARGGTALTTSEVEERLRQYER